MQITSGRVTRQAFVVDRDSLDFDTGRSMDWDNVGEEYRLTPGQVITVNGAVAADAASITVDPLTAAVPAGTLLNFGQASENVRVTTDAAAGATSLAVDPDHAAIEDNDTATIPGSGAKFVPAGTRVGTLLAGGPISPRVATTNPAVGILLTDAYEDSRTDSRSGYAIIVGGVIYENLLPGATGDPAVIPSAEKTELQTAGVGTGFAFKQYLDSSAS